MVVLHGFVINPLKSPHHCWRGQNYSNSRCKITSSDGDDDANGNDGDDANGHGVSSCGHRPIQPWR
jgi:hypothetical protein